MYSKEQPRKGFGGPANGGGYESSQSDLDLTSGSDSDSSAAVGAYHSHHRQGNGVSRQEQSVPQQQQHHHHQQQHVEEAVEVVRREPKMRGNRVRPGLPQIQERKKVSIDDFQLIKVLGRGCMGKVTTSFVYFPAWRRTCKVYPTSKLDACSSLITLVFFSFFLSKRLCWCENTSPKNSLP